MTQQHKIPMWEVEVPRRGAEVREEICQWFVENEIVIQRWYSGDHGSRIYVFIDSDDAFKFKLRFG